MVTRVQRPRRWGAGSSSRRLALGTWLVMTSCGPPPPSPERSGEPSPAPRCSQQGLLAFDPQTPVARRILLPPAVQETSNSEQHLVERSCAEQEDDDQCAELAAQEARARHPAAEVTASVMHQRQLVRVVFEVSGQESEALFGDHAAALAHLRSLEADGQAVRIKRAATVPDPESPRIAVARATVSGPVVQRAALRLELLVHPADGDSVGALRRVQSQAQRAGFAVHSWTPRDDGALRIELGCTMGPPAES